MRQMVHVFQKDCRHLWPTIGAVLLLIALHAYGDVVLEGDSEAIAVVWSPFTLFYVLVGLSGMLLPFALLFLVASVVQEEAPVGTEQFWLTRPYDRVSLVIEKLVFLALFASLPLLLHDIAILLYLHLPLPAAGSLLLWKQAQFCVFLLIAATLAALTRTLAQFALASIGAVVLGLLLLYVSTASGQNPLFMGPPSMVYLGFTLLVLFGVAGMILIPYQYFRRRTALNAAIAIGFLCAGAIIAAFWPERLTVYLKRRNASAELSSLRLRPDPQLRPVGFSLPEVPDTAEQKPVPRIILFPFEATGLPSDVGVALTTSLAQFQSPAHQAIPFASPNPVRFQPAGEADSFLDRTGPNQFIPFFAENTRGFKDVADTEGVLKGKLFLEGYRTSRLSLGLSPDPISQQPMNIGQDHCLLTSLVRGGRVDVTLRCLGLEPGRVSRLQATLTPQPNGTGTGNTQIGGPDTWPAFFSPVNRITASFQFEYLPADAASGAHPNGPTLEQSDVAPNRRLDIYIEETVGGVVRDFRIEHLRPAEYDVPAWRQRGVQFASDRASTFGQKH